MRRTPASALVLALLSLAAPLASAAAPVAAVWSPYAVAGGIANAVALSDDGSTAAVAWAPVTPGTASTSASIPYDTSAFNASGIMWNSSTSTQGFPVGKDLVAVTPDGSVVVSANSVAPSTQQAPNLAYFRTDRALTPPPANAPGQPTMGAAWTKRLQAIQAMDVSDDGALVAVAERRDATGGSIIAPTTTTTLTLRVFEADGRERISLTGAGNATSLVFPSSGRVLVGGEQRLPDGTATGFVELVTVQGSVRSKHVLDRGGVVTALGAAGGHVVAGTEGGLILHFLPSGSTLGAPDRTLEPGVGPIRAVAVAKDGNVAVVGGDKGFAVVRLAGGLPTISYNATLPAPVAEVDVAADGTYALVVAGQAYGYETARDARLWNLTGPFDGGQMDDAATRMVLDAGGGVASFLFGRGLVFRHLAPEGPVENVTARAPGSDGLARFDAVVVSEGSAADRVRIDLPNAPGVEFTSNVTEAPLPAGGRLHVGITVRPTALNPGTYTFEVTAVSLQGGAVANLTLPVQILPRGGFAFTLTGQAERVIPRGGSDQAIFVLENRGNERVDATVSAAQSVSTGAPWTVDVQPTAPSVVPGGRTSVAVLVTPPPSAANGTTARITVTARTDQGTLSSVLAYTYSPDLSVRLDTPSRVRFVGPAQATWFNLTVQNTGSVRAPFEVFYEKVSETGAGWNVDVDVAPFNLSAGQKRDVVLKVYAPNTGTSTDRVTLFVEVRSLEKIGRTPVAAQNVTLIANLDPDLAPRPPTDVPCDGLACLPAPGVVAALGAVGAAALLGAFEKPRRPRK